MRKRRRAKSTKQVLIWACVATFLQINYMYIVEASSSNNGSSNNRMSPQWNNPPTFYPPPPRWDRGLVRNIEQRLRAHNDAYGGTQNEDALVDEIASSMMPQLTVSGAPTTRSSTTNQNQYSVFDDDASIPLHLFIFPIPFVCLFVNCLTRHHHPLLLPPHLRHHLNTIQTNIVHPNQMKDNILVSIFIHTIYYKTKPSNRYKKLTIVIIIIVIILPRP